MKTTSRVPLAARVAQKHVHVLVRSNRAATIGSRTKRRGVALLSVLWLAAALSAIAFTVANLVRAETDRALTEKDAVRAYYLASGAIDRAMLYVQWGPQYRNPDGSPKYYQPPMPVLRLDFPTGSAAVEVIPDNSKLNVNTAPAPELRNLLVALGVDSNRAASIAGGILDWRTPSPGGSFTEFDRHYLSLASSFRSRHSSFQEIEELLLVQGVTPDLFYGSYSRSDDGRLVPHAALRDCLSVYGAIGQMDANTVEPAVMQAIGISPDIAAALVALRKTRPIRTMDQLAPFQSSAPAMGRLGLVTNSIMTFRATARLKLANGQLSEVQRSVSALVKFLPEQVDPPFHILRWYDNAVSLQ
jgi:general secretion pathway protein K